MRGVLERAAVDDGEGVLARGLLAWSARATSFCPCRLPLDEDQGGRVRVALLTKASTCLDPEAAPNDVRRVVGLEGDFQVERLPPSDGLFVAVRSM